MSVSEKNAISLADLPACPVETTLTLISDKWKVLILRDLMPGTKRFGELKKSIGHVSQKVLTSQLRQMEQSGLVSRKVYAEVPPRVEYTLTDLGYSYSQSWMPCGAGEKIIRKNSPPKNPKLPDIRLFFAKNVSKPVFCFETFLFSIFPGNSDCFLSAPLFPSFRLFHHTVRSTPDTVRPEV